MSPLESHERRAAVAAQRARYDELRAIHLSIANDLQAGSMDDPRLKQLLDDAHQQLEKWENNRLCSPLYIKLWRRILRDPGPGLSRLVKQAPSRSDALLQNTPFTSALNRYRQRLAS